MPEVLQKILRSHGFEREFSVFGARVAKRGVFGRCLSRHAKLFIGPGAQVNLIAAIAAERPKFIAGRKNAGTTAGRAFDHRRAVRLGWVEIAGLGRWGSHGAAAQKEVSKPEIKERDKA